MACRPSDKNKTDNSTCWWFEWNEYTIGTDNISDFGHRVFFHPLRKLDLAKFRLWTDLILLTDTNCYLFGSFHFEARNDTLNPCNYIARDQWLLHSSSCSVFGVVPPFLSSVAINLINPSAITGSHKDVTLLLNQPPTKR